MNAIEALQSIQRELGERAAEQVPEGWRTLNQWADESGLSVKTVDSTMKRGVTGGVVERKQFSILTGYGVRRVWHYKPVSAGAKKRR